MRRVLITGSNRGIGLALTRTVLARGNRVFATCRSPDSARDLRALAPGSGDRLSILRLDLTDPASHLEVRGAVSQQAGALDDLINNAAIYKPDHTGASSGDSRSIDGLEVDDLARMFAVNTIGPMMVTRRLMPLLRSGSNPSVTFLSTGMASLAGKSSGGVEYGYSTSKAALNMLTRVLANELVADRIRVIAVDPGWVRTDMGGPSAPLDPQDVADEIWRLLRSLPVEETGRFVNRFGKSVPW